MDQGKTEIPQLKVKETPANCPVPPPCPVCPPKLKPTQVLLKVLLVLGMALVLAVIILVGSGLRITRKESLLDIWLASRRGVSPTPEVLATPTPDPTADWETYTNEKYGYLIKYPSQWEVTEGKELRQVVISGDIGDLYYAPLSIQVYENTKKLSIEDWAKEFGWENIIPKFTDIKIDSKLAVRWKDSLGVLNFIVQNDDKIYNFSPLEVQENIENQNLMMEKILSTFKFLTPIPTETQTKGGITQETGTPVKIKSVYLVSPIKGPLVIKGTVEPGWMFEGVMPVKLLDATRVEIASGSAKETVPGSWQSGKTVEFSVELTFTTDSASGFLVFQNDNPSGLPENQKSFEMPVKFRQ